MGKWKSNGRSQIYAEMTLTNAPQPLPM